MAWSVFPINCPVLQETQESTGNWPWKGWISRVHWREIIHKFCSRSAYRQLACYADVQAGRGYGYQHSSQHKTSKLLLNIYNDKHIYIETQGFMDLTNQSQSLQGGKFRSWEEHGVTRLATRNNRTLFKVPHNLALLQWELNNSTTKYVLWESALRWDGQEAQKAGGWRKLYKQHQKIYPQLSLITKKVSTSVISGK